MAHVYDAQLHTHTLHTISPKTKTFMIVAEILANNETISHD